MAEDITVRDKATQRQKEVNARFRWFDSSQSLGMVDVVTVSDISSWRSLSASVFASLPAWLKGEVASARAQDALPVVTAFFESPEDGQIVSGISFIRGWAFSERGTVPIRLSLDGQPGGIILCCSERADVAAAYPDNPNALHSGWGTVINYGLLNAGQYTIEIDTAYRGYTERIDAHTVTVVRPGGFEFLDQFDFSTATAQIVTRHPWSTGEEILLRGVQVRDKVTQQTKTIDVALRWFEHAQSLGIVAASE